MSQYRAEKEMRSCFLDKNLVAELEAYIKQKAKSVNQACHDACEACYDVEISDSFGTEKFASISEYSREAFPSDISGLRLSFICAKGPVKAIEMNFGLNRYRSKIRLQLDGENSRETASGIMHAIDRILKENGNLNYVFYKYAVVQWLLFSVSVGLLIPTVTVNSASDESRQLSTLIILASLFLWCVWGALAKINPYTLFDTKRNANLQKGLGWLLKGVLGVAIFGAVSRFIWQ